MDEYIKRIDANCAVTDAIWHGKRSMHDVASAINSVPSADVAPVRHGRWERTSDGAARCTACKRKMNPSQYGYAFCSLCGAKMDGGNNIMRGELNEKV